MEKSALITGASGGIGLEMARLFARDKVNLLLVARNEARLISVKQELEKDYGIKVHYVAADLSVVDSLYVIRNYVEQNGLRIDYLVNNAGFGDYGAFTERSIEKYREMIGLNITMLVELTHYFARKMVEHGSGKILNIASVAGFQPDPYFAVYGASKAFVINFTEALHRELKGTGVTTTVLSPGATETEFMSRADMKEAKYYKSGVMTAGKVAAVGYSAIKKGKLHVVPGWKNKLLSFFSGLMPSSQLRLSIAARVLEKV